MLLLLDERWRQVGLERELSHSLLGLLGRSFDPGDLRETGDYGFRRHFVLQLGSPRTLHLHPSGFRVTFYRLYELAGPGECKGKEAGTAEVWQRIERALVVRTW